MRFFFLALGLASCGAPFTSSQTDPPDVGTVDVLEHDASDETLVFSGSSGLTSDAGAVDGPADTFAQSNPADAATADDASTIADCLANYDRACVANPSACSALSVCNLCPGACD